MEGVEYEVSAEAPVALEVDSYIREDIPFEPELQRLLMEACMETSCPYNVALAVIHTETRYQNLKGDGGNSFGYMQVQPRWSWDRMERMGVTDLMDPLSNFRVGCDILSEYCRRYPLEDALSVYNTGSTGSRVYSTKVLGYMDSVGIGWEV